MCVCVCVSDGCLTELICCTEPVNVEFCLCHLCFFRQAAKECRRRKREYVNCLEAHVSTLELQNKKLLEELKYLKESVLRSQVRS